MDRHVIGWVVVLTLGCGAKAWACDPPARKAPREASVPVDRISIAVVDERGAPPSTGEARLFESRTHAPVLAPGRSQLTYAQFMGVSGNLTAQCVREGTAIRIRLSGLVPDGSYSLWTFFFAEPGRTPSLEWATGAGVLGRSGGGSHVFTATSSGDAYVALTLPTGPLSTFGWLRGCALDEYQWMIVGTYNLDGRAPSPQSLLGGTVVEQFGFQHRRGM